MLQSDCIKRCLKSIICSRNIGKIKLNTKPIAKKLIQYLAYCSKKCMIFLTIYAETVDELNIAVTHYQQYYNVVKNDLKSVLVCESIELVILAIQNNFEFVAHC